MKNSAPSPRVSIIIPMFNSEKYIATCINSILAQSFQDFELIVVDDCSSDRSAEIVESFEDPRIRLVRNIKNLHCDLTRNIGLTLARGEFIYFMDSDDAILGKTLETLVTAIEESGAEVVHMNSRFETIGESFEFPSVVKTRKKYIKNPAPRFFSDDLQQRFQEEFLMHNIIPTPWIKIQRRDFLLKNKIRFPNTRRGGDLLFNLAEICLAKKIQVIDFCGYVRHFHPEQITQTPLEKLLRINIQNLQPIFRYIHDLFASKNLDLSEEIRAEMETDAMLYYFKREIYNRFKRRFNQQQIAEIFREIIMQSRSFDSEFTIALLNMLTRYMIRAESMNV